MTDIAINSPATINYPYTAIDLTEQIELFPNSWGRLNDLGLFPIEGIGTTHIEIELTEGQTFILDLRERGQGGTEGSEQDVRSLIFKVPGATHKEVIRPREIQDRIAFGGRPRQVKTVDSVTAKKLAAGRRHYALTLEYTRMGALKGVIRTGTGRVLYNLYDAFDVPKTTIDFKLGTGGTDVFQKVEELNAHMEDNLMGETMSGVRVLTDSTFFRRLASHPSLEKYYLQHGGATALADAKMKGVLSFEGGVTFERYRGNGTNLQGQTVRFIDENTGHAFPEGTQSAHKTYVAPADHMDHVNEIGTEIFVSPHVLPHGQGIEFLMQSHPLPLWNRPALLVECTSSN